MGGRGGGGQGVRNPSPFLTHVVGFLTSGLKGPPPFGLQTYNRPPPPLKDPGSAPVYSYSDRKQDKIEEGGGIAFFLGSASRSLRFYHSTQLYIIPLNTTLLRKVGGQTYSAPHTFEGPPCSEITVVGL